MSTQIQIISSTGVSPYTVKVCDITDTYCYTVATSVTFPYTFISPPPLSNVLSFLVKIIDNSGCEVFHLVQCDPDLGKIFQDGEIFIFMDTDDYIFQDQ
jgi:hypothetical protein